MLSAASAVSVTKLHSSTPCRQSLSRPSKGILLADPLEAPRALRPRVRCEADPARVGDRPADRVRVEALMVDRLVEPEREQVVAPPRRHLDAREQQHLAVPALLAAPPRLERVVVGQQHDVHLRAPARAGYLPDGAGAVRVGRVQMDHAGEVVHPPRPSRGRAGSGAPRPRERRADPGEHGQQREPRRENVDVLRQPGVLGRHVGDADRQRAERAEAADLRDQRGDRGSTAKPRTSRPTTATTWLRTSAPMPTPKAPSSAATSALRAICSSSSPAPGVGRSRTVRMMRPTMVIAIEISSERTSPATANAIGLAVRKRSRSGAASSELVIVW